MYPSESKNKNSSVLSYQKASLTIEAALIMPLFLYFILTFVYFLRIIAVQEQIQAAITKTGLDFSKAAYVYGEFLDPKEVQNLDQSVFTEHTDLTLYDLSRAIISHGAIQGYVTHYLDQSLINLSCIKDGVQGICFTSSEILEHTNAIDIVASYRIEIPIKFFPLPTLWMLQRVKIRAWTGRKPLARYILRGESDSEAERTVYITETGSRYHFDKNCTHIKLSVRKISGIPTGYKNNNGAFYYPCEACCKSVQEDSGTYYITDSGTRYHTISDCSKIKRTVMEVALSSVGDKSGCLRCTR